MEKIKELLKFMQSNPRLYLANYFGKEGSDEKAKYLEIIAKIEEIEQDFYKRNKPFNT
jgi:hypothetical protein